MCESRVKNIKKIENRISTCLCFQSEGEEWDEKALIRNTELRLGFSEPWCCLRFVWLSLGSVSFEMERRDVRVWEWKQNRLRVKTESIKSEWAAYLQYVIQREIVWEGRWLKWERFWEFRVSERELGFVRTVSEGTHRYWFSVVTFYNWE
jgi:hypothetical protein